MADRVYPKLSTRNIEAETLHEIQSRRSQRDMDLFTKINSRKSMSRLPSSPSDTPNVSQSFWRDFGPLEVTTCVTSDGKQVVLVFLEGRVCLNGEPIRVLPNGKIILSNGKADFRQQSYFDLAMKVRNETKHHSESHGKTGLDAINPTHDLQDTVCEVNSSVAKMAGRYIHKHTSKPLRQFFQRKQTSTHLHSDLTTLVSLLNTLNHEAQIVAQNFDEVHEKLYENECALLALVKTVICFSTEAILSEPGKYTNAVYKEMYEKYNEVVAREKDLVIELREMRSRNEALIVDNTIMERKITDMTSQYDEQSQEMTALRHKNRQLSLNHTKSVSQSLNLESQSSILEVQLEQLQSKSKSDQRHTKDTVEKLRYLQKRLQNVKLENDKLKNEQRKTNDHVRKLSLRSRQQSKSISTLQDERIRVENDRDRLIKVVRGALHDRNKMTSCLTKVKGSKHNIKAKNKE